MPTINPQDHSLTYARSPRPENNCLNASDGLVDCIDTQRVPDDASEDAVNISLMANSNGSFDDISPPVIPTPLAPSYSSTPPLVATLISPILPSVDNILAGETFLPSPMLLDPTPIPPILRNDTGVTDAMVYSSPPLSPSTKDVIDGLVSLPSQLTPEFLEPTPPEVPLAVVPNGSSSSNPAIASIAPVYPSSSPILPSTADVLKGDVFLPSHLAIYGTYGSHLFIRHSFVWQFYVPRSLSTSHTSSLSPSSSSESSSGSRGSKVLEHDSPALSLSPHDSPTQQHQLLGSGLSNNIATGLKPAVVKVPFAEKSVLVACNAEQDVRSVELLDNDMDVKLSGNDLRHKIRGKPGDQRLFLPQEEPVLVESQSDADDKASSVWKKTYLANIETTIATLKAVFRGNKTNPIPVRDIPDSSIQANSSNSNAETSTAAYDISRDIGCIAPPAPISSLNKPTHHLHHPASHRRIVTADIEQVIAQARGPPPIDRDPVTCTQSTPAPSHPHSTEDEDDAEGDSDPDGWIPAAQERLARLIEVANPPCPDPRNTPPPLDPDLKETVEPDDLNSSQDLLLPDSDQVRLEEFRSRWFDTFAADSSWLDFTSASEQFAAQTRQLAQDLLKPDLGRNQHQRLGNTSGSEIISQ